MMRVLHLHTDRLKRRPFDTRPNRRGALIGHERIRSTAGHQIEQGSRVNGAVGLQACACFLPAGGGIGRIKEGHSVLPPPPQ